MDPGCLDILLTMNVFIQSICALNIKCNWSIGSWNCLNLSRTESSCFSWRLKMTQFTFLFFISYLFSAMEHLLQYQVYWAEEIKTFVQCKNELRTNINRTILETWRAMTGLVTHVLLQRNMDTSASQMTIPSSCSRGRNGSAHENPGADMWNKRDSMKGAGIWVSKPCRKKDEIVGPSTVPRQLSCQKESLSKQVLAPRAGLCSGLSLMFYLSVPNQYSPVDLRNNCILTCGIVHFLVEEQS